MQVQGAYSRMTRLFEWMHGCLVAVAAGRRRKKKKKAQHAREPSVKDSDFWVWLFFGPYLGLCDSWIVGSQLDGWTGVVWPGAGRGVGRSVEGQPWWWLWLWCGNEVDLDGV